MSNNRDVDYDNDSYFFLASRPLFYCPGRTELIRDKSEFKAHWTEDLERWFEDGV
jgi:hypothetical protein